MTAREMVVLGVLFKGRKKDGDFKFMAATESAILARPWAFSLRWARNIWNDVLSSSHLSWRVLDVASDALAACTLLDTLIT